MFYSILFFIKNHIFKNYIGEKTHDDGMDNVIIQNVFFNSSTMQSNLRELVRQDKNANYSNKKGVLVNLNIDFLDFDLLKILGIHIC